MLAISLYEDRIFPVRKQDELLSDYNDDFSEVELSAGDFSEGSVAAPYEPPSVMHTTVISPTALAVQKKEHATEDGNRTDEM
jgi:hypothetical protein